MGVARTDYLITVKLSNDLSEFLDLLIDSCDGSNDSLVFAISSCLDLDPGSRNVLLYRPKS